MGDGWQWQATDARIITSGGRSIPSHCSILASASASPVLESLLDRTPRKSGVKSIPILGVPCDSIEAFLRLLYDYSPRWVTEEAAQDEMERYGMHLLVLSHVYRVGLLKRACEAALAAGLTADVVVDVLQLARQCDAPRLYLTCMKLIAKDLSAAEQSAWGFVKARDPGLELEIVRFRQDADLRLKRRRRRTMEQGLYEQLSEAMECLQHICTEGCTDVGPRDKQPPNKSRAPCTSFQSCRSLQLLIRHFAACGHKRGCPRCKRMRQLFASTPPSATSLNPAKFPSAAEPAHPSYFRCSSFECLQLSFLSLCVTFGSLIADSSKKGLSKSWGKEEMMRDGHF